MTSMALGGVAPPGEVVRVVSNAGSNGSFAARTWFASDGESNVQDANSLTVWDGAKVEHTSDLNRPERVGCQKSIWVADQQ